jgi:hypothetical protein
MAAYAFERLTHQPQIGLPVHELAVLYTDAAVPLGAKEAAFPFLTLAYHRWGSRALLPRMWREEDVAVAAVGGAVLWVRRHTAMGNGERRSRRTYTFLSHGQLSAAQGSPTTVSAWHPINTTF